MKWSTYATYQIYSVRHSSIQVVLGLDIPKALFCKSILGNFYLGLQEQPLHKLRLQLSSSYLIRNAIAHTEWFSNNKSDLSISVLTTEMVKTLIVGYLTIKGKHVYKQWSYSLMEILPINHHFISQFPIYRFHIFINSLFSKIRKYTLLTLENVSISDSCINIFPPLSVSNCKLVREQLPKYKPQRPKPTSDQYPESHSTQLISSQFIIQ